MLVGVVLSLVVLAASPEAHHALHKHAGHGDHACAVTLAQAGYCDTAVPIVLMVGDTALPPTSEPATQTYEWRPPHQWHVPANGPPTV